MGKLKLIVITVTFLIFLVALVFVLVNVLKPKVAGIYIESNPSARVYIDGLEVGRTPYEKTTKQKEIVVKLVPNSFNTPLVPYETRVSLSSGVQTVIKRDFGDTEETSSGEIISFERIEKGRISLAVVSIPDSAELVIDGKEKVYTPFRTTSLSSGIHSLLIKAEGYKERTIEVRMYDNYKLTVITKLAKLSIQDGAEKKEIDEEVKEETKEVVILSTPTGFLRVRSQPSILGAEVGTVKPNNVYELLETDESSGWYKIRFSQNDSEILEGWVSNQYARIVE